PVAGLAKPTEVDYYARVRCYQALLSHYPAGMAKLALLPLAMRLAGPREAVWHAIVRKNYGCSHLIVDGSYTAPRSSDGTPFYSAESVHELFRRYEADLGIEMAPCKTMVYVDESE